MAKEKYTTPPFRVSYPQVFKPRKNDLNDKMEYSVVALFPKEADLSKLKQACAKVIAEKWPAGKPAKLKSPFRDQGERAREVDDGNGGTKMELPDGYVEGCTFITLKSTQQPGLVDQAVNAILEPDRFYAGCWARATVTCYAYESRGDKGQVLARGVNFGLSNLQLVKDDEPFSGRRKAEEDFEPLEGAAGDASSVDDPFAD